LPSALQLLPSTVPPVDMRGLYSQQMCSRSPEGWCQRCSVVSAASSGRSCPLLTASSGLPGVVVRSVARPRRASLIAQLGSAAPTSCKP
jgi:hypothetical protein